MAATNFPLHPTSQSSNAVAPHPAADPYPTADLIHQVCPDSDLENIKKYAPYVLKAMCSAGLTSKNQLIAMIATIYTEVTIWAPIEEYGKGEGTEYGTTYFGRGFIQLTWRKQYLGRENPKSWIYQACFWEV